MQSTVFPVRLELRLALGTEQQESELEKYDQTLNQIMNGKIPIQTQSSWAHEITSRPIN